MQTNSEVGVDVLIAAADYTLRMYENQTNSLYRGGVAFGGLTPLVVRTAPTSKTPHSRRSRKSDFGEHQGVHLWCGQRRRIQKLGWMS
ncbi:hypothetical protein SUGI_1458000 [Cryptomeria japonica]|uniref:Uncharacterized protein n=1 Tax=Cryptomeria japonica TaxID=3369 RepID=A0AAD3RR78_CRYJA|nr:hypothetical protein SUGI_1319130 [Cryptomeria japonica]GLJ57867.1 hypothetical protein SUGI_1382720 [Cryptomeria japonica]GLJ58540.1 hypothetical protein SUGI_1458000 [Cryptomeria japonica]